MNLLEGDDDGNQSELPRLLWVLRNGKGFGLYFVCCNAPAYRRELVEQIKAEYALPILEFDLTGHDGEAYIDHRLLTWAKDQPAGAPVFLYGLETLLPTRDEDRQFRTIQEINWRRNVYSQLGRNLVIWLPEYALTLFARQASDFYDWHSAVFEFPVPEADKTGFIEQSLLEFTDGETHAANRMSLAEKKRWMGVLKGLMDETPKESLEYARLLDDLGRLHRSLGEYGEALKCFQNRLDIFKAVGDKVGESTTLYQIARIYRIRGELDKALRDFEAALAINRQMDNRLGEADILKSIGGFYYRQGDYTKALDFLQKARVIMRKMNYRQGEAQTLQYFGSIYFALGDTVKALDHLREALAISREVGNRVAEAGQLDNISFVYLTLSDYQQALAHVEAALKIQREMGHRSGICISLCHLGQLYARQGNLAEAERAGLEAYRIAKEIGHTDGLKALDKLAKDLGQDGLAYWEAQL